MWSDRILLRIGLSVLFISSTERFARAELVECTDCCESDQQVAFTSFNSNITDQGPLTWSVTSNSDKDPLNKSITRYWRGFYLSSPPSLNLSDVTDFSGCGIYLYNITAALQIDESFSDYPSFSCTTVMSSECQRDLLQQASDEIISMAPETNLDFTCESFAANIAEQRIPESCAFSNRQPTWDYTTGSDIAGQDFTLRNAMKSNESSCSLTNDTIYGATYNTLLTESKYISLPHDSAEAKAFQNGTTPVLTMFFNRPNQAQNSLFLPEPEIHLSCLKTIPTEKEQQTINNDGGTNVAPLPSVLALMAIVTGLFIGF